MAQVINPPPTSSVPLNGNRTNDQVNDENAPPSNSNQATADGKEVTVFHDPENFNVKHPLQHQWTLWFTKPPSAKGDNWNDLLKEIATFDSVEEFWGIYANITACSELALKSDYHLFKRGVRPEWEDAQNKHGGKWSYMFKDKKGINIDELWLHLQLAAIGENLERDGDNEVMGVVINVRKAHYRLGLWTRTKNKGGDDAEKATLMRIGQKFKETLKSALKTPVELAPVEFSGHTEAMGAARAKAILVVS